MQLLFVLSHNYPPTKGFWNSTDIKEQLHRRLLIWCKDSKLQVLCDNEQNSIPCIAHTYRWFVARLIYLSLDVFQLILIHLTSLLLLQTKWSSRLSNFIGWCNGESTCLPPMWAGFDSQTLCHVWVESVVCSHPCSERFFSGYSGFPFSRKPTVLNSNSIWKVSSVSALH